MTETQIQPVNAEEGRYVVSCNQIPRQEKEDQVLETAGNRDFNATWVLPLSFLLFILGLASFSNLVSPEIYNHSYVVFILRAL